VPTPTTPAQAHQVSISGPSKAAVGAPVNFVANASPEPSAFKWGDSRSPGVKSVFGFYSTAFASGGCYTIFLTAYFETAPLSVTASHNIAVGEASCP
jgi:hypothetical protein